MASFLLSSAQKNGVGELDGSITKKPGNEPENCSEMKIVRSSEKTRHGGFSLTPTPFLSEY